VKQSIPAMMEKIRLFVAYFIETFSALFSNSMSQLQIHSNFIDVPFHVLHNQRR